MTYSVNVGYSFKLPSVTGVELVPDGGSIILCSGMPSQELVKRNIEKGGRHLNRRLLDPQLYLAGLDVAKSAKHCVSLGSYPWFGLTKLDKYTSRLHNRTQWRKEARKVITDLWPSTAPKDQGVISDVVRDCVEMQEMLGCRAIIAPSPLTVDPTTTYEEELFWLDATLKYAQGTRINIPIYATVALADNCVRYLDPKDNTLLARIADAVSAREVDGVYLVLEQGGEPTESRSCGDTRSLHSILHLVHVFAQECNLRVMVNFLGQFGLACEAAGAAMWASGWYKSLYRLRLADKLAGGSAYPSYWSHPAALDIHLKGDFDNLNTRGVLTALFDRTEAATGLLSAASSRTKVNEVPGWSYRQGNITAASEHFLRSSMLAEERHAMYQAAERCDFVENWLRQAVDHSRRIEQALGANSQTRTQHVQAWLDAFLRYRRDHNV